MPYQFHPSNPHRHPSAFSAPQVIRKPLKDMTPDEVRAWIAATRAALQEQQQRGRAYLDYRAKRGVFTPTDAALERDQTLAADLLQLLDEREQSLAEQGV